MTEPLNDTAEVIKFSIIPERLWPGHLDSIKFKILNGSQINLLKHSHNVSELPNYLYICCLKKTDTSYVISVQNRSFENFGSGGSLYINIGKRKDSLFVIDRSSGSTN
jgi:hypothetical protein